MVLLKGFYYWEKKGDFIKFTFHYGSIKREEPPAFSTKLTKFTFHYGSIKSL